MNISICQAHIHPYTIQERSYTNVFILYLWVTYSISCFLYVLYTIFPILSMQVLCKTKEFFFVCLFTRCWKIVFFLRSKRKFVSIIPERVKIKQNEFDFRHTAIRKGHFAWFRVEYRYNFCFIFIMKKQTEGKKNKRIQLLAILILENYLVKI